MATLYSCYVCGEDLDEDCTVLPVADEEYQEMPFCPACLDEMEW